MKPLSQEQQFIIDLCNGGWKIRELRYVWHKGPMRWRAEFLHDKFKPGDRKGIRSELPVDGRAAQGLIRRGMLTMVSASQFNGTLYELLERG